MKIRIYVEREYDTTDEHEHLFEGDTDKEAVDRATRYFLEDMESMGLKDMYVEVNGKLLSNQP